MITLVIIDNVRFNMRFLIEIMFILKAIKSHFSGSYDKQNLTLVVISYENLKKLSRRLVSLISYEMAIRVGFTMYMHIINVRLPNYVRKMYFSIIRFFTIAKPQKCYRKGDVYISACNGQPSPRHIY